MAIKDKKKISLNQTKPGWYKRKPETYTKKKRKRSWKLELRGAEKEERKIHGNEKTTRQKEGGGSKD